MAKGVGRLALVAVLAAAITATCEGASCPCDCTGLPKGSCPCSCTCEAGSQAVVVGNITDCEICPVDTYSDGTGPCVACPQYSTTNDNTGQTFCICRSGFELVTDPTTGEAVSPLQCADINECEGENNCHAQATCTNNIGLYECKCNAGWRGDGVMCQNIDECAEELQDCDKGPPPATCTDTLGSFTCECTPGALDWSTRNDSWAPGTYCIPPGPTIGKLDPTEGKASMQVIVPFVVGHVTPGYDLDTLQFLILSSNNQLVNPSTDIKIQGTKASRFLLIRPRGKLYGTSTISVAVRDATGADDTSAFLLTVIQLSPFFDDNPPANTFKDMKTVAGTPTFPYTFLVGHEDADLVDTLSIEASSSNVEVIPNTCCDLSEAFEVYGGIFLNMSDALLPASRSGLSTFARQVTVVIRPLGTAAADAGVELAFRLRDANGRVTIGRITLFVYSRPSVDKFCAYDVRPQDTLSSVSDAFGMHWLTLFLLNNHTIRHPDRLPPGLRLSTGRPYVVKSGDSLYSIATRFGTTWQHIMTTNADTLLDQQSVFEGQLLCLAPDLAFITCRGR